MAKVVIAGDTSGTVEIIAPNEAGSTVLNLPEQSGDLVATKADGVLYENKTTISNNYTLSTGQNALSVGPITVDPNVTITIPVGQRWVIL